jgi:hypothetical protein
MARLSIYVIRSKHNVVKIGIAARPRQRLSGLQSASHSPLSLDYTATVTGDARTLEIHVHKALESRRVSGEWFRIASSRAISVIIGAAEALGYALARTDASPVPASLGAAVAAPAREYVPTSHGIFAPRLIKRLTLRDVAKVTARGRHADGGNLYLKVSESGTKSWTFFYRVAGKQREMGLGSTRDISLAEAREMAAKFRSMLANGIDPLGAKRRI